MNARITGEMCESSMDGINVNFLVLITYYIYVRYQLWGRLDKKCIFLSPLINP